MPPAVVGQHIRRLDGNATHVRHGGYLPRRPARRNRLAVVFVVIFVLCLRLGTVSPLGSSTASAVTKVPP